MLVHHFLKTILKIAIVICCYKPEGHIRHCVKYHLPILFSVMERNNPDTVWRNNSLEKSNNGCTKLWIVRSIHLCFGRGGPRFSLGTQPFWPIWMTQKKHLCIYDLLRLERDVSTHNYLSFHLNKTSRWGSNNKNCFCNFYGFYRHLMNLPGICVQVGDAS